MSHTEQARALAEQLRGQGDQPEPLFEVPPCGDVATGMAFGPAAPPPVFICDRPAAHDDEWHQQSGGPMWRRRTRDEFA